jgi:hypothetical protein
MRLRTCSASLLAAVALSSLAANADDRVAGTRSEKLVEQAHAVAIRLGRDHAELTVRRTVFNGGRRHDQAMFWLDVPEGAVATGLRTLGAKDGQPTWFEGELMEAEAAAAKYRELTGIGGYYPKDPALLSWRNQRLLALQVFPCAPAQPKTIEYTYRMPVHYHGGRYHVTLPAMGTEALRPLAVVSPMEAGDRVYVDGARVKAGAGLKLDKDGLDLALARRAPERLDGLFASVPMSRRHGLSRFGIEAAPHLSTAPRGAYVVVVLDASRSLTEGQASAEVAAAKATLGHLPGAHVEVLTFDRAVHARHHGFAPVTKAIKDLDRLVVERHNGSRFDDALAQADALLAAKAPPGAARRILAITDLSTRSSLTPEKAQAIVKSGALLHIGVIEEADPKLTRDDEHPWARVALATKGVLWQASASAPPIDAPEMKRVYEEWARPVRVHKLAVSAKGLLPGDFSFPETLDEGEGIEDLRLPDRPFTEVVLSGELWAEPVRKVLAPDEGHGKLWSAMVFGSAQLHELDEKEMMYLAVRGHAVSPVTSLLAIEPGVRPSTEGLEVGEGGGGRGEGIGLGSIGTFGHGAGSGFDPQAFLRDALRQGAKACGGAGRSLSVVLETTRDEVVDVPSVAARGAADAKLEGCVAEAAWALDLPRAFSASFARFTVEI